MNGKGTKFGRPFLCRSFPCRGPKGFGGTSVVREPARRKPRPTSIDENEYRSLFNGLHHLLKLPPLVVVSSLWLEKIGAQRRRYTQIHSSRRAQTLLWPDLLHRDFLKPELPRR